MFARAQPARPQVGNESYRGHGCALDFWKIASNGLRVTCIGYCLLLAVFWLLAAFVGERNPLIALLLLLPPLVWGLPLAVLFLPSLIVSRRIAGLITLTSLTHLTVFMGYECAPFKPHRPADPSRSLTLLSYNRGQHNNQSLQPFKNHVQPDIIVLQDAKNRAGNYRRADTYAEFPHIAQRGEFVILSKFPIELETATEDTPKLPDSVARIIINFNGTPIALYAVHTMTPRDWISSVKRGGFLFGILGIPGTPWAAKRRAYSEFWNSRISEIDTILKKAKSERLPTIIIGDLNIADTGFIYRRFSKNFTDSHDSVGSGYGNTFPGKTRNPAALFQPWLRLDYAFSDSRWKPVRFITEKQRPSQHRAIATTLTLL